MAISTNPTKQVKTYTGEQEVFTNSPIYDKPENSKQTGYAINNKVIVIEKYNDNTYKVQSDYFERYMWVRANEYIFFKIIKP
ncbi:hypothetical protein D1632_08600 [Chryseobacterium nematophagum]|uniref:SH3 domain-containing protein n=1 Tax=Chryseobacterium nematophagum TaxID=2305228 RepID=A0A3M7LC72_9FLAO|nr:hypothetical protein [Chryseobacterium nematophagum]RMZ59675.1 hypothetical protein D1632_08600 [Chryseobacterium nematophagum]